MWKSLSSNIRYITNYSSFLSSLKRLMFEKMNTSFVSSDCCCSRLNTCAVIAAYHNHSIKGWCKSKHMLGGNYWQRLQWILFSFSPRSTFIFLYSGDIISYYNVPRVYIFMLFVYVIKLLLILYLVH